jgi:cytochrome c
MKLNKHVSLAILAAGMMTFACGGGGNETQKSEGTSTAAPEQKKEAPGEKNKDNPDFVKGLTLVKENDCPSCHMVERKIVGPSYAEVAEKYEYNDENVENLASRVIAGSVGEWGEIPMPAHPNLSKEDAEQMVKYVLLLK